MNKRYCLHPVVTKHGEIFPCGHCPVCRMKYRKQMALRMYLEQSIDKPKNSFFITLTYAPEYIPSVQDRPCFCKAHVDTFLDSLRHSLRREGVSLRYFLTCEYGEEGYRPHYHACLLLYGGRKYKYNDFNRDFLSTYWRYGFTYISGLTAGRIMYCTAYALKDDEYLERDWSGFEEGRPFRLFSRRPGLGLTDSCINWWTDYLANGGEYRSSISVHGATRDISSGVPTGVKRKIRDYYEDTYECLKDRNNEYLQESVLELFDNAKRFGSYKDYSDSGLYDNFNSSPDEEIKAFRKALRRLSKSNSKPI